VRRAWHPPRAGVLNAEPGLIRRYLCRHPDLFRSVRELGRVPARPYESGEPDGRSSA
jgi:hypothetical protein